MALSLCTSQVDINGRELAEHGKTSFPIACYHDNLLEEPVPWHWHEELEAAVVTEGEAVVAVDAQRFQVKAGDGFFVNSGVLHGCWNHGETPCRFHSMCFHPRLVGGSVDSVYWTNYLRPLLTNASVKGLILSREVDWHRDILELTEKVWQAFLGESFGYEFAVRELLSEMILGMVRHVGSQASRPSAKTLRDGERIKQMLQYIHDHYSEELVLEQIAGSASVSESECLRCFRSTIGTTPGRYLKSYRMQRAAELLKNTEEKIVDVGVQCGFQDMSYFAKSFREAFGCSPSAFRERPTGARTESLCEAE